MHQAEWERGKKRDQSTVEANVYTNRHNQGICEHMLVMTYVQGKTDFCKPGSENDLNWGLSDGQLFTRMGQVGRALSRVNLQSRPSRCKAWWPGELQAPQSQKPRS